MTIKYSIVYHPESNGQIEVLNRGLETYLRCFVDDQPRKQFKFLHLVEQWYNSTFHSPMPSKYLLSRPYMVVLP